MTFTNKQLQLGASGAALFIAWLGLITLGGLENGIHGVLGAFSGGLIVWALILWLFASWDSM